MPLVKSASKEAFRKNIRAEITQGKKPVNQAAAIAYAVQRAAKGKPKTGGMKRTMPMPAPKPKMGRANMMGRTMMKKGV